MTDGPVYICPHQRAQGGSACLFRLPRWVGFPFALGLDGGEPLFPAHLVRSLPDVPKVVLETVAVLFPVHKADGVKENVTVEMFPVHMGGNDRLVPVSQQAAGKLHPGGMGLFRRHFSWGVGVDEMIAQHAASLSPAALGGKHLLAGGGCLAVEGCHQRGFFWVRYVPLHTVQGGFLRVGHILRTLVQAAGDGDDFVVGH